MADDRDVGNPLLERWGAPLAGRNFEPGGSTTNCGADRGYRVEIPQEDLLAGYALLQAWLAADIRFDRAQREATWP